MQSEAKWEQAFNTLDKRVFSADAVGGYDFIQPMSRFTTTESFVLDFGCGKGQMVQHMQTLGYKNVWGTDPSSLLLKDSPKSANLKLMTDHRIPFADDTFDFVYCSGVLHHIGWDQLPQVLKEVGRVLKNGGHFLYAEPRKTLLRSFGHVVVMSLLNRLSKNARALSDCLEAEWPTYGPWLDRQDEEFLPLCLSHGFKEVSVDLKSVTVIGTLRLTK